MKSTVKLTGHWAEPEKYLEQAVQMAYSKISNRLLKSAKKDHVYQNRSGNLTASHYTQLIKKELVVAAGASYAEYVKENTDDDWLTNAIKNNWSFIKKEIEEQVIKIMNGRK